MSLLQGVGVFLPGIVTGILLVDLFWEERTPLSLILKFFLGTGIGLGVTSLLYFVYMLVFAGWHFFIYVELAAMLLVSWLALRRGRLQLRIPLPRWEIRPWQVVLLAAVVPVMVFAALGASSEWVHRPFGTWDAFMIYDRSARFVYRGQADWMQTFSPDIDPAFHADYPLLIPLDIAQAWDVQGRESQTIPRVLDGIFMLACAGMFVSGIASLKSVWQAAVGLLVMLNTPFFILSGASQTADVPLSFFILSTVILICLYVSQPKGGLLILAGLTAGLAAWTKNEGDLFVLAILAGLFLGFIRPFPPRQLLPFLAGLAIPLIAVLYFKFMLAPANDILGTNASAFIQRLFAWSRHRSILDSFRSQSLLMGGPWVSVIPLLAAYALIFGISPKARQKGAYVAIVLMAAIQAAGYYFIYLITPHPLSWQLDFSLWRVLFHIYLPLLFLFFVVVTDVEESLGFKAGLAPAEGVP